MHGEVVPFASALPFGIHRQDEPDRVRQALGNIEPVRTYREGGVYRQSELCEQQQGEWINELLQWRRTGEQGRLMKQLDDERAKAPRQPYFGHKYIKDSVEYDFLFSEMDNRLIVIRLSPG